METMFTLSLHFIYILWSPEMTENVRAALPTFFAVCWSWRRHYLAVCLQAGPWHPDLYLFWTALTCSSCITNCVISIITRNKNGKFPTPWTHKDTGLWCPSAFLGIGNSIRIFFFKWGRLGVLFLFLSPLMPSFAFSEGKFFDPLLCLQPFFSTWFINFQSFFLIIFQRELRHLYFMRTSSILLSPFLTNCQDKLFLLSLPPSLSLLPLPFPPQHSSSSFSLTLSWSGIFYPFCRTDDKDNFWILLHFRLVP